MRKYEKRQHQGRGGKEGKTVAAGDDVGLRPDSGPY